MKEKLLKIPLTISRKKLMIFKAVMKKWNFKSPK